MAALGELDQLLLELVDLLHLLEVGRLGFVSASLRGVVGGGDSP